MININLAQKYTPKTIDEFVGNPDIVKAAINDVHNDMNIILAGEPGIGKTCLAYLIGNKLNMKIVEINSQDFNKSEDIAKITMQTQTKTLFGKSIFLFDEVDDIKKNEQLYKLIKASAHPIILTTNSMYKVPYNIKQACKTHELKPPNLRAVTKRIKEIAQLEKIPIKKVNFNGVSNDVRSSIFACFDSTEKIKKVENDFRLTTDTFVKGKITDLHPAWLMDNIHGFYNGMDLYESIQVLTYAIELNDNYLYSCLPKAKGGKAKYPYYLRKRRNW